MVPGCDMTPAELTSARNILGMTQGALATALGASRRAVQFWEAGERAIPELVARVIRAEMAGFEMLDILSDHKTGATNAKRVQTWREVV